MDSRLRALVTGAGSGIGFLAPHTVKELIEPAEVTDTVAFLLTPAGRAITGLALPMDMGWSAR